MRLLALIFGLWALTACGQGSRTNVRDYNFYIDSDDPVLVETVTRLMTTFNHMAGANVLMLTFNASASSRVSFADELHSHNGYVGYGSWEERKDGNSAIASLFHGSKETRTYSMDLVFDKSFFLQKAQSQDPDDERDLLLAFCHEVGHGLMMDHQHDPTSVMYSSMNGAKERDYAAFFQATRAFLHAKFRE